MSLSSWVIPEVELVDKGQDSEIHRLLWGGRDDMCGQACVCTDWSLKMTYAESKNAKSFDESGRPMSAVSLGSAQGIRKSFTETI